MMVSLIVEHAGSAPVSRLYAALGLSRSQYYRCRLGATELDADLELRDLIQRAAREWPSYGYRRVTHELRRRGVEANHKRVLRLMRQDNLRCLRSKRLVVTTDSEHGLPYYPNLVPELEVRGIDQLWVADITYVRLLSEFIYLAVVLDAFGRRCVGWALGRTLGAELAVTALETALGTRSAGPGLVHHSDRGVQYASTAYTKLLKERGVRINMSRRLNPYDNAQAERFVRMLKEDEVYLYEGESLSEAEERIGQFLDEVFNQTRLHSAIGYVPPAVFEQMLLIADPA